MHPVLRAASEARLGLFTTAEALRAGYGVSEIRALCRSGGWVRLRRGVLIEAATLAATEANGRRYDVDCLALLLSLDRPSAVLSHASAARLWELPTPPTLEPAFRLTDPVQWRRGRDYLMACAPVSSAERWRTGPLPLTSAARTLVDCARDWPREDAVLAMDAALLAGRTTPEALRRATAAVHHCRGAGRAARATALADGRAESPLETRGRLRIVGAGLPAPELQVEVRAEGRLIGVVDAWFDEAAVAVEFDGRMKYADPVAGSHTRAGALGGETTRGRAASPGHPCRPGGGGRRPVGMAAHRAAPAGAARRPRAGGPAVRRHPTGQQRPPDRLSPPTAPSGRRPHGATPGRRPRRGAGTTSGARRMPPPASVVP